jgi:hypothetical protein
MLATFAAAPGNKVILSSINCYPFESLKSPVVIVINPFCINIAVNNSSAYLDFI